MKTMNSPREVHGTPVAGSCAERTQPSSPSGLIIQTMISKLIERIKDNTLPAADTPFLKQKLLAAQKESRESLIEQVERRCTQKITDAKDRKARKLLLFQHNLKMLGNLKVRAIA